MEQILMNSYMPAQVICGEDCVRQYSAVFKKAGRKCLLVTGKSGAKLSGALGDVCSVLDENEISYLIYDGITENPSVADCFNAGCEARRFCADFVIGIGGGSALDAAKAVAIFSADPDMDVNSIYSRKIPAKRLPLYLVGTTAGTGSEVTGVSVLTDAKGFKKSISGADCYAVASFCDAKYTMTANYNVTVSTALDAYAHALESYFSSTSNDLSELYAVKALSLLWNNLVYLHGSENFMPNSKLRNELYTASLYAGLAINVTGTAFPHTAGYILTEKYGIAHGKACTAFHPQLLDKAEKYRYEKFEAVCRLFGTDKNGINDLIGALTNVRIRITQNEATEYCARWTSAVKNFDRTPGGYTPQEAIEGLLALAD